MTEIELPEHASDPKTRTVGILVGVVGIFLSVVTIASHRAHTQAVITRTESNDDWAFYQAKKIRANVSDAALTLLTALASDQPKAVEAKAKLEAARDKELGDTEQLRSKAEASEKQTDLEEVRALKFDIGEGLLELGLVLCSLFFLARNSFFPIFGVLSAAAGIAMGIWGWLL
jgi:anti-sigma28 factor (negative regulator of flagellin synthesis)